jgi:GTP-binding protein
MPGDKDKLPSLTVALVGRPNVGKSTLFNRFVGRRAALVHDTPGVTRDRKEGEAQFMGLCFRVIDTPGLYDPNTQDAPKDIVRGMTNQTLAALLESDHIFFIIDGMEGCTPYDQELASLLRKQHKPITILVNKCENSQRASQGMADAVSLGLGDVIPISAEHGQGMGDIFDILDPLCGKTDADDFHQAPEENDFLDEDFFEHQEDVDEEEEEAKAAIKSEQYKNYPLKLLILGRPNVGKSTLVNALLGEERQLVADMPGVTRDAISLDWSHKNRAIKLIDTAGIRRGSRIDNTLEKLAVMDARRNLQFAEMTIVVIDGSLPLATQIEKQDLTLIQEVLSEGRGLVIAVNKWDLVSDPKALMEELRYQMDERFAHSKNVPLIPISAQNQKGLEELLDAVLKEEKNWNKRITTRNLNRWLEYVTQKHMPPAVSGRRIRLKYMAQKKSRPPTFVIFGNQLSDLPDSYVRYLSHQLRNDFDFGGVPLRIQFKNTKNPYADK